MKSIPFLYLPAIILAMFLYPASALADLTSDYNAAVEDARNATYGEIVTSLTAICNENPDLEWENNVPGTRVKVVSMMGDWAYSTFYQPYEGSNISLGGSAVSWVTVVPDMKNFFQNNTWPNDMEMRLKQLLGLSPAWSYTKLVELWVNPDDLFRPSPDPEIIDHESSLTYPTVVNAYLDFNSTAYVNDNGTNATYVQWFEYRNATVYDSANKVPWTRLGYTYDWNASTSKVGLSEFCIRQGSTIGVIKGYDINDYFTQPGPAPSSSSNTGCLLDPEADLGWEWLLPIAAGALVLAARRRRAPGKGAGRS